MKDPELILEIIKIHTSDILGIEKSEITLNSHFRDDLGCDSLTMSELIMVFENKFKLIIPDGESEELTNVDSVVNYIMNH